MMKILVADDEPSSRRILSATLARFGHAVEVVEDGDQAWARLDRQERPDMVVLDWQMPGLDGPEICRRLRQGRSPRYTYAILVTSRSAPNAAVEGLESGADDFVTKPFDPGELRARVRAGERIIELQAAMARSRAYLDAVLANIESGVLLVDHAGRIVYGNDALAKIVGAPIEDALGMTREQFIQRHASRLTDPAARVEHLRSAAARPMEAQVDLDLPGPAPRTFRWLTKPVSLPEGQGQLELYRDVTDEVHRAREQEERARLDHLTRLYNRRAADEIFARELSRARRTGGPISLVMCDIDWFKRVNDTYGHGVGDEVLRQVSAAVASCCRATDVAIRWGGEELLVLLSDTSHAGALAFGERVRARVESMRHPGLPPVTISCGVAELTHAATETLDATLEQADARLYAAKAAGRNAVC